MYGFQTDVPCDDNIGSEDKESAKLEKPSWKVMISMGASVGGGGSVSSETQVRKTTEHKLEYENSYQSQ